MLSSIYVLLVLHAVLHGVVTQDDAGADLDLDSMSVGQAGNNKTEKSIDAIEDVKKLNSLLSKDCFQSNVFKRLLSKHCFQQVLFKRFFSICCFQKIELSIFIYL